MNTNHIFYPFYSEDVPQQELNDPKVSKLMMTIGAVYVVIFALFCFFI